MPAEQELNKVLSTLDAVDVRLKDFEKSSKAEIAAATKGVETVQNELANTRKQLQEIAEIAKKGRVRGEQGEVFRDLGETIVKSYAARGQKAASGGTDASGGYLVNDDLRTNILSAQNQYGVVRRLMAGQIVPMASDVTKIAVDTFEDTSGNVPVPGAVSENAQISASNDAQLSQVTLTASKYATLNYVSNELMQDAFVDFLGAYLFPKIARQKAKKEDQIVFTTASTGLLASSNIQQYQLGSGQTSFSDLTGDDLRLACDSVVSDALANGRFIMHRSMGSFVRTLKGSDGQYLWAPLASGDPATIDGYPYEYAEVFPARTASAANTGFALFGDLRLGVVVGERGDYRMDVSNDFRFDYDQVAVRMVFRFAMNTNANIGRALVCIKTANA